MKILLAILSILKNEITSDVTTLKGLLGYALTLLSMITLQHVVLILTIIYWVLRVFHQYKQMKNNNKKENE